MTGDLSDDLFLGGRLRLLQPRTGHRFGGDAALLVAAARSLLTQDAAAVDLGAGVGAVGLGLARCGAGRVTLVEIDPALADIAVRNADRNGLGDRVMVVAADVADFPASDAVGTADLVAANPPFDAAASHRASPVPAKARAHVEETGAVEAWIDCASRLLKTGGAFVLIHRPEALGRLLDALAPAFGDVRIRPVHPRAAAPAGRVLIAARRGGRGPLVLLPALVMHGADGRFTAEADAAQRGEAELSMA